MSGAVIFVVATERGCVRVVYCVGSRLGRSFTKSPERSSGWKLVDPVVKNMNEAGW